MSCFARTYFHVRSLSSLSSPWRSVSNIEPKKRNYNRIKQDIRQSDAYHQGLSSCVRIFRIHKHIKTKHTRNGISAMLFRPLEPSFWSSLRKQSCYEHCARNKKKKRIERIITNSIRLYR